MAESIQYSTFGRMMIDHAPYLVAGAVSIIGITMVILRKAGVLFFGSEKKAHEDCKHCEKNGDNNNNAPKIKCDSHETLCDVVDKIDKRQAQMFATQDSHGKALANGKKEFRAIQEKIGNLRVGIAVLLERSGGAVKEFDDIQT